MKRKLLSMTLVVAIIFNLLCVGIFPNFVYADPGDPDDPVANFADPNLQAAIASWVGKSTVTDAVYKSDIITKLSQPATNNTLNLLNKDISSLEGMEIFNGTSLETLILMTNKITDITPIAGITSLKHLELTRNNIQVLSPLSGLVNLEYLSIGKETLRPSESSFTNINALSSLTNLKTLKIVNADITDLSPLSGLTMLEELTLYGVNATDLSPISTLTGLSYLDLRNSAFTSLVPLASLTNLEYLDISWLNNITSLNGLQSLYNLNTLIMNNTGRISDISPILDKSITSFTYGENFVNFFDPANNAFLTSHGLTYTSGFLRLLVRERTYPYDNLVNVSMETGSTKGIAAVAEFPNSTGTEFTNVGLGREISSSSPFGFDVIYTIDDSSIVEIQNNNTLVAKKAGTAHITAKISNDAIDWGVYSFDVTVTDPVTG